MLYGCPGIGKTTFCAGLEKAIFLDTEKGSGLQRVYRVPVEDWDTFLKVIKEILNGKHEFKNVIIDTVGRLTMSCMRFCVQKLGITHPSEAQFGKAYDVIKKTFDAPLHQLQHSPYAVWMVAHEKSRKIEGKGITYDYKEPDIPGYMSGIVIGLCDFIFLADVTTKNVTDEKGKTQIIDHRILRTKPGKHWRAKDRLNYQKLPEEIPLDTQEFLNQFHTCLNTNMEQ